MTEECGSMYWEGRDSGGGRDEDAPVGDDEEGSTVIRSIKSRSRSLSRSAWPPAALDLSRSIWPSS